MKFLKRYKVFLESEEFGDDSDVSISKERLNKIQQHLKDYKSKKTQIDSLYKKGGNVSKDDLIKIIGEDGDRNEFLSDYANIVSLNQKISDLHTKEDMRNAELSNMKIRLDNANDDSKETIQKSIDNITNDLDNIKMKISEIQKNIPIVEKEHKEKIKSIEKDIQDWIKKISI